jgi:hypothetical protein
MNCPFGENCTGPVCLHTTENSIILTKLSFNLKYLEDKPSEPLFLQLKMLLRAVAAIIFAVMVTAQRVQWMENTEHTYT